MPWPTDEPAVLPPAVGGLVAQWSATAGPMPRVLRVVCSAPRWLFALTRAHAIAAHDRVAAALLATLEHELATILGEPMPRWPRVFTRRPGWRHSGAAPIDLDPVTLPLPCLDPTQHLLLTGGMGYASGATRNAIATLLDAAFGPGRVEGDLERLDDDIRAEALGHVLPLGLRVRWNAALGLSPPALFDAIFRTRAIELVTLAFPDELGCAAIAFDRVGALDPGGAVDLIMSALAIRAALRGNGSLELPTQPTRTAPTRPDHAALTVAA